MTSPEDEGNPAKQRDNHTQSRNFRVPDELWQPFMKGDEARGDTSASEVLRQFIVRYNRETYRRHSRGELPGFQDGV